MNSKSASKKSVYLEVLRIIALFLVLFNHSGGGGYILYFSHSPAELKYWLLLCLSVFDKIAVPIFFMISGFLLLGKQESLKTLYKKRVLRFVVILIAISFVYRIYYQYTGWMEFGFLDTLKSIYQDPTPLPLWYLYRYLGFLVMLPLLRKLAVSMSVKDYLYMIAAAVVFSGILPLASEFFTNGELVLSQSFRIYLINSDNIFFPLLGYFLGKKIPDEWLNGKRVLLLNLIGAAAVLLCAAATWHWDYISAAQTGGPTEFYHAALICLPASAVFLSVRWIFLKVHVSQKTEKILTWIGGTTFGIYLLEGILREQLEWLKTGPFGWMPRLFATLAWILCCCLVGFVLTSLWKLMILSLKKLFNRRKYLTKTK